MAILEHAGSFKRLTSVCVLGISATRYRRRIYDIDTHFLVSN